MTKEEMQIFREIIQEELKPLKNSINKIEIALENRIDPNIKLIAEGHSSLVEKQDKFFDKIQELTNIIYRISDRVVVLEMK